MRRQRARRRPEELIEASETAYAPDETMNKMADGFDRDFDQSQEHFPVQDDVVGDDEEDEEDDE